MVGRWDRRDRGQIKEQGLEDDDGVGTIIKGSKSRGGDNSNEGIG